MIQFVGNIVAVAAFGEACHYTGRVRHTVAALTGRNHLVLVLVTGNTQQVPMFCITAGKGLVRTLMAGGTHLVWRVGRHVNRRRHMGLVTFFALGGGHFRAVRLVTLGTERDLAVNIVAEGTRQRGMLALDLLQLDDLLGMAGQALVSDIVCQLDYLGGMRVGVAAQTVGQVVMSLAGVALAAGRNNLFHQRRVAGMAVLTIETRLVGATIGGDICRCSRMTLVAVRNGQCRLVSGACNNRQHARQQG